MQSSSLIDVIMASNTAIVVESGVVESRISQTIIWYTQCLT